MKWLILIALMLSACIQGPWEYKPKNDPEYYGVYTEGTLIADRSITDICFERLLKLTEYYTDDFAFYNSADIRVTGPTGTVSLSAKVGKPNCFDGPDDFIIERGESYTLTATITWDSSGTIVESTYGATANVPTRFEISDTATVNEQAFTNQATSLQLTPQGINDLVQGLPAEAQQVFFDQYGDLINEFFAVLSSGDTVAATQLFEESGAEMLGQIESLYQEYEVRAPYVQGDTIYYLTGILNTTSHYYHFDFSDDAASVLVTHRFTDEGAFGLNSFSETFQQFGIEAERQYFSGRIRRLIHYPNFYDPTKDLNVFDSLPVTNTWYVEGMNTFYFYGYERAATEYINTYIQEHDNPKVKPVFNIEGGRGLFAGAIVDSFQVNILNPDGLREWTVFETTAGHCAQELVGWDSTTECLDFEVKYCRDTSFDPQGYLDKNKDEFDGNKAYSNCIEATMRAALADGEDINAYLDQNPKASEAKSNELDKKRIRARYHHCTERFFQESGCEDLEGQAHQWTSRLSQEDKDNDVEFMKELLWKRCKDDSWLSPNCDWAHRAYCVEKDINSDILCRPAEEWCETQTDEIFCQKEPGT